MISRIRQLLVILLWLGLLWSLRQPGQSVGRVGARLTLLSSAMEFSSANKCFCSRVTVSCRALSRDRRTNTMINGVIELYKPQPKQLLKCLWCVFTFDASPQLISVNHCCLIVTFPDKVQLPRGFVSFWNPRFFVQFLFFLVCSFVCFLKMECCVAHSAFTSCVCSSPV